MIQAANRPSTGTPVPSAGNIEDDTAPSTGQSPRVSRRTSGKVIRLADFQRPRAATDLADARSQLQRFLPPMPDMQGLSEMQTAAAIFEWYTAQVTVYRAVLR